MCMLFFMFMSKVAGSNYENLSIRFFCSSAQEIPIYILQEKFDKQLAYPSCNVFAVKLNFLLARPSHTR